MSFRYLFCGSWSKDDPVSGLAVFRADGEPIAKAGAQGTELAGQSILAVTGDRLISVCETRGGGHIVSYRIQEDGRLEKLAVLDTEEGLLSYVAASPDGRFLFVSSMEAGAVLMLRLEEDGGLRRTDEWKLTGHSIMPRQQEARLHSVMPSPDGSLLAAANLGADELELFRVDAGAERLRLVQSVAVDFGRMPRHMAFHPSGRYFYLLTETGNRIYVYLVRDGRLWELAAYNTLDPEKKPDGMAADIVVSADGRFVYASNRGQSNVAVFQTLPSGLLDSVGYFDCGGKGPRGLNLSPDGGTLFCANHDSGTVTALPVNPETGVPGAPAYILDVPFAACVRSI